VENEKEVALATPAIAVPVCVPDVLLVGVRLELTAQAASCKTP
jgi:hypothetical protein